MTTVIRGDQIKDLTIEDEDIAPETITGDKIAASTISGTDIASDAVSEDKLSIANAPVDGYFMKYTTASGMVWAAEGSSVSHSNLLNLNADDHTQYLTTARGDARYYTESEITTISGDLQTNINDRAPTVHTHDDRYYTEGEVDVISGSIDTKIQGTEKYHGVESMGALSFNNSTHIVTVASGTNVYWYKGSRVTINNSITCDLDDYLSITARTLYYVYFDDDSGTLKAGNSFWDLHDKVPISVVYWNGSAGAIGKETHSYTRDIDWHINAHLTIGARYYTGIAQTYPSTISGAVLSLTGGTIYDEDLAVTFGTQTISRVFYQAAAGSYTFADSSLPYAGSSGDPQYLDTDNYTLTSVPDNQYVVMWVYATNDVDRPIYIIPTSASTAHGTVTSARSESIPSLSGLNLVPEIKLIYKWIYKGDGAYQEGVDYRNSSSLPAGGVPASNASSVVFVPYGNISSTNVQIAIQELDDEKLSITQFTTSSGDIVSQIPNTMGYVFGSTILTTSGSYAGEYITATVDDASAVFGDVLYCAADFHYDRADADSATTMPAVAVTLENGSGSKKILLKGQVCNTAWNWSSGNLFVSATTGQMTQTVVSGVGQQAQIVGFALSADTIYFNPSYIIAEIS